MIHHAFRMERFAPMFAWQSFTSAKGEVSGCACRKKTTISPNILLEHYVPAYLAGTSCTSCIRSPKEDAQQFCYKLSHEELSSVMK